jgi:hypothetical protein
MPVFRSVFTRRGTNRSPVFLLRKLTASRSIADESVGEIQRCDVSSGLGRETSRKPGAAQHALALCGE